MKVKIWIDVYSGGIVTIAGVSGDSPQAANFICGKDADAWRYLTEVDVPDPFPIPKLDASLPVEVKE